MGSLGAHLDSWDFGTGAQDNGAGVAQVLEAARAIAAMPQPLRAARYASRCEAGEERELLGSEAYARAHANEMKSLCGRTQHRQQRGPPEGLEVRGARRRSGRARTFGRAARGARRRTALARDDLRHRPRPLHARGIPALDMLVDMTHYEEVHHKASDTLDKVNAHGKPRTARPSSAVTAYAIAEQPEPCAPAPRTRARRGDSERKAGLDEFLTSVGVWKP